MQERHFHETGDAFCNVKERAVVCDKILLRYFFGVKCHGLWFVVCEKIIYTIYIGEPINGKGIKNICERRRTITNTGPKNQLNLIFYQTTSYKKLKDKRRLNVYANFL
jgi:hypothetical protein